MSLVMFLCLSFSGGTMTVDAAGKTEIDTLSVAFGKVNVGDTLDTAFKFENATNKTLRVPADANYTVTLAYVHKVKDGQKIKLWEKDDASLPWSRVETQFVEKNVAYSIRVRFKTNDGYKLIRNAAQLRSNMQVLDAELGKGKDIEIWDSAGMNSIATIVDMDFLITKGLTYIGNIQTIYPEIGKSKTGTIGFESVDTGFFISGAPGPYTYAAKIAPIGTKIQTSNVFDKSNCYYQITAVNSMDYGTMYITTTAADGKTCDIPVKIAAVSGGHEHTWVETIEKIDFEHHGYTKCTAPACPGVAPAFDKNSHYAVHEFVGGCTEKCITCGNLNNPNAKHNLKFVSETPATCSTNGMNAHYTCEGCGKYFDEDKNETTEAALNIPATGDHNYGAWVSNGDGTHTRTCTTGSHSETENCSGGTATCEDKAVCSVCGAEYGEKLGHDWGEATYTWTDNTCKAERVCKHDSTHIESEMVIATGTTITGATCKEKGKMKYTATFVNTAFNMQEKEVDIDFAPHTFGAWQDEIPATAEDFGTKGHKDCTVCGKHFDKDGNEITEFRIAKIGTHNVIVNGESNFYAHGESVTVTAEDKEGKVFKGWQDETGEIVSTQKEYTFKVEGEKKLTAVYDDAPVAKKGLSGGQIAGIVIGSLLLAGIGGFAIYWFAISKKTFADLGTAFKNLFKKKK